jgi:hypothetical protein
MESNSKFHIKEHPFAVWVTLGVASGEYFTIKMVPPGADLTHWLVNIALGPLAFYLTMIPVGFFVVLLWSALGWWD